MSLPFWRSQSQSGVQQQNVGNPYLFMPQLYITVLLFIALQYCFLCSPLMDVITQSEGKNLLGFTVLLSHKYFLLCPMTLVFLSIHSCYL